MTYRISTAPRENGTIVAVVTLPPEHRKETEAARWVAASKAAEIMARELADQLAGIELGSGVEDE